MGVQLGEPLLEHRASLVGAARGVWFRLGAQELHIGVEEPFAPAGKAHPAFAAARYEELVGRLRAAGVAVTRDDSLPGTRRCYVHDPWGNRLELLSG